MTTLIQKNRQYANARAFGYCRFSFTDGLVQADVLPVETGLPRRIRPIPNSTL